MNNLREIRKSRGLTLEQAARLVGCSAASLSRIENGKFRVLTPLAEKLVNRLCIDVTQGGFTDPLEGLMNFVTAEIHSEAAEGRREIDTTYTYNNKEIYVLASFHVECYPVKGDDSVGIADGFEMGIDIEKLEVSYYDKGGEEWVDVCL